MSSSKLETAVANKLKKWLNTAKETETHPQYLGFGLSITRLTSIKSLCKGDKQSAQQFGLFIAKQVEQMMNRIACPERYSEQEWNHDQQLVADGIQQMEQYLAQPSEAKKQELVSLLKNVEDSQGDDIRRVHWTTVHFVRSGYLLKLEYALRCFVNLPTLPEFLPRSRLVHWLLVSSSARSLSQAVQSSLKYRIEILPTIIDDPTKIVPHLKVLVRLSPGMPLLLHELLY